MAADEAAALLGARGADETGALFEAARGARRRAWGDEVYLYGFVYFSTYCRNNCNFCYYRRDNDIPRYRKSESEIMRAAESLIESGVHLIDLTMGEDPLYYDGGFEDVLKTAARLKAETGVPLMISPGAAGRDAIAKFAALGVDFFALYQETFDRELFARLRPGQDFDARLEAKAEARARGMNVEEGLLLGFGEEIMDDADSILKMCDTGARQLRVMTFVPRAGVPLEYAPRGCALEYNAIAVLRLLCPDALIPASLDVEGMAGLRPRLDAGANVVTSIIPADSGLAGVAGADTGGRAAGEVRDILKSMGLRPARKWLI